MEYSIQIFEVPWSGFRNLAMALNAGVMNVHDHFIPHHRNNYYPYVLRHRTLGLFSTALICFKIFVLVLVSAGPLLPAFSSAITPQNITALTNVSRTEFGLRALSESNILDQAAQAKANDMLAKGYFSHTTPDGKTPWDFITAAGYNYITAGENLAVNFTEAENVEQAWMNSPGHKANIVNKNYEEIGVGISEGQYQGHAAIFVVQMFGTQMEQKFAVLNKPTLVKQPKETPSPAPRSGLLKTAVRSARTRTQVKPASTIIPASQIQPTAVNTELTIDNPQITLQADRVDISARLSENAVKAMATFGQQAIMLSPAANGAWHGQVETAKLGQGNLTVKLVAYDIEGKTKTVQLADFSNTLNGNYNIAGVTPAAQVSFFGKVFNPKSLEYKFYLYFIAAMLASLALAIGIRRHIQHISLIANTSFVVILACMLWMGG